MKVNFTKNKWLVALAILALLATTVFGVVSCGDDPTPPPPIHRGRRNGRLLL